MSSSFSKIVRFDELRTLDYASTSSSFVTLGTPFQHIMRIMKFVNNTDGDMIISFDGTTSNEFVPAGGFVLYDLTCNRAVDNEFVMQIGTQIYVKRSSVPTKGDIYAVCIYGKGQ
jgi:hypothetical protein